MPEKKDPFEGCVYRDERKALEFTRRHGITSHKDVMRIIRTTRPDLDPVRETFLIGLNGFPNKLKGRLTAGNTVLFNYLMRNPGAEPSQCLLNAQEICRDLRIHGDPQNVVRAVLACLKQNESDIRWMEQAVEERLAEGVKVVNPGKWYGLRKSIRQDANATLRKNRGDALYQVRRYDRQSDLEDFLQGPAKLREVHISEEGDLPSEALDKAEFLKGLLWIIRSEWFTKKGWPQKAPFYAYERTDNTPGEEPAI